MLTVISWLGTSDGGNLTLRFGTSHIMILSKNILQSEGAVQRSAVQCKTGSIKNEGTCRHRYTRDLVSSVVLTSLFPPCTRRSGILRHAKGRGLMCGMDESGASPRHAIEHSFRRAYSYNKAHHQSIQHDLTLPAKVMNLRSTVTAPPPRCTNVFHRVYC